MIETHMMTCVFKAECLSFTENESDNYPVMEEKKTAHCFLESFSAMSQPLQLPSAEETHRSPTKYMKPRDLR